MSEAQRLVDVATVSLRHEEDGSAAAVVSLADWMHVVSAAEANQILKMMVQQLESEGVRFYLLSQANGD